MLEGSGKAFGFSPTTGGGVFSDLLAQPLTVSSGSSKASKTALFLGSVGIGNLLLVAGVDLALAEGFAGVIQGSLHQLEQCHARREGFGGHHGAIRHRLAALHRNLHLHLLDFDMLLPCTACQQSAGSYQY